MDAICLLLELTSNSQVPNYWRLPWNIIYENKPGVESLRKNGSNSEISSLYQKYGEKMVSANSLILIKRQFIEWQRQAALMVVWKWQYEAKNVWSNVGK